MDRRYLNPRVKARKIRFIIPTTESAFKGEKSSHQEMKKANFACMRVELFGKNIGKAFFI